MTTLSNANLLIAAQLYGVQAPAAKARREAATVAADFEAELTPRAGKDRKAANPTLQAPGVPRPLEPAKRFDAGAGRKDTMPPRAETASKQENERLARPGAQLDIRV